MAGRPKPRRGLQRAFLALTIAVAAVHAVTVHAASGRKSGRAPPDMATPELEKAQAADRAAVAACLEKVAEARKQQTLAQNKAQETEGPQPETLDAAAWLARAGERAAIDDASCIGVVSDPCQKTEQGRSNVGGADCYRRELAVWNERLNKAYRAWIDDCDDAKVCAARKTFERAWIAKRDARCALPWIEFQGTMAIPMTSWCLLEETARQAIWMEEAIR